MYQIQVKRNLIKKEFPLEDGWTVKVDIDAMEKGKGKQQKSGKKEIAEKCLEDLLKLTGNKEPDKEPGYERVDIFAEHPSKGVFIVEVEGESRKQPEQSMYSSLGQIILSMHDEENEKNYGLAVPEEWNEENDKNYGLAVPEEWKTQLIKIPRNVCRKLNLTLYLVGDPEVQVIKPSDNWPK
jgi:hypothetical protein